MKKCQHIPTKKLQVKLLVFFILPLLLFLSYPSLSLAYTERRITDEGNDGGDKQAHPVISEKAIVWQDYRNDIWNEWGPTWTNIDIYGYTLPYPGSQFSITAAVYNQFYPAIYQNQVVWQDFRNNSDWNIYLYNIAPPSETQITTHSSHQTSPDIYGNKIAFQDGRNGNADIYIYDLSTGQNYQITTNSSTQDVPKIFGDRIVWEDWRNAWPDIYMYDLSLDSDGDGTPNYLEVPRPSPDPAEVRITSLPKSQILPDIYGDKIVWMETKDDGTYDIYMYDLSTGQKSPVTTASGDQKYPAIYGDWVVWEDERNGNDDIYAKNLSGGSDQRVTTNTSNQSLPEIYGNRVVWEDYRYGEAEIYYIPDLFADPVAGPPTVSSTDPSSGQSGVSVNASVKATFSEDIDKYTINTSTFTLYQGATPIAGATAYNSSNKTAFFVSNASLSPNTTYTATLTTGVKDKAGNSMSSNYSWNLTTGNVIPLPGDSIDMLVKFETGANGRLVLGTDADVNDYATISLGSSTIYNVDFKGGVDVNAKVTQYNNRSDVAYAEPNYTRSTGGEDSNNGRKGELNIQNEQEKGTVPGKVKKGNGRIMGGNGKVKKVKEGNGGNVPPSAGVMGSNGKSLIPWVFPLL